MSEDNVVDYCFIHQQQVPCRECLSNIARDISAEFPETGSIDWAQELRYWMTENVLPEIIHWDDSIEDHYDRLQIIQCMEAETQDAFLSMGTAHSNIPDAAFIPATGTFLQIPASVCHVWTCMPHGMPIYLAEIWGSVVRGDQ